MVSVQYRNNSSVFTGTLSLQYRNDSRFSIWKRIKSDSDTISFRLLFPVHADQFMNRIGYVTIIRHRFPGIGTITRNAVVWYRYNTETIQVCLLGHYHYSIEMIPDFPYGNGSNLIPH